MAGDKIKRREYHKKWRATHKDNMRASQKKYSESHKDYYKKWRETHKKYMREYSKKYCETNRDFIRVLKKQYYKANKEFILNRNKLYRQTTAGKKSLLAGQKKYQCTFRGRLTHKAGVAKSESTGKNLSFTVLEQVYKENIKKYGTLTCYLCLKPVKFGKEELEHKIPFSRGGTNKKSNLGISCCKCNRKKHSKTDKEFLAQNKRRF